MKNGPFFFFSTASHLSSSPCVFNVWTQYHIINTMHVFMTRHWFMIIIVKNKNKKNDSGPVEQRDDET